MHRLRSNPLNVRSAKLSKKQKLNKFFCRYAKNFAQTVKDWNGIEEYWEIYDEGPVHYSWDDSLFLHGDWYATDWSHMKKIDHELNEFCYFSVWIWKWKGYSIEDVLEMEYMGAW